MTEEQKLTRNKIYLAALLHDIGKFYQRADEGFSDVQNELSQFSKAMANDICPVNDAGRFGYQHVIWTNEFFEKIKLTLEKISGFKENVFEVSNEDNIFNLACNHHQPKSILQAIITMSDWWSAGIDRRDPSEKEELDVVHWGKTRYKNIPLYSIFNSIKNGNTNFGFPLKALDTEKDIFPKDIKTKEDGVSNSDYKKLWKSFLDEFSKLPKDSLGVFTESLTYLLKKYTWCIPSNTMDMANVSLFDHLKTTAAFADCIYAYQLENPNDFSWNNTDKKLSIKDKKYPVILLGGDISGIQKFIYNIASRKAANSLKGRSFYLQLLIDSMIQRIISHEDIQASIGHVIYSSGGKFYMLLPNTKKVITAIDLICQEIEKELWDEHKGKLIFNLDFIPFAYKSKEKEVDFERIDGSERNLGALWKNLAEKLTGKKNKKFKSLFFTDYTAFFEPQQSGGNIKVCAVTGEELAAPEQLRGSAKEDEKFVSKAVNNQIKLGEGLKDVDFLITYKGNNDYSSYLASHSKINTTVCKIANYLFDRKEIEDAKKITSADASHVISINNTDFLSAPINGSQISYGFQFYGGNKQARKPSGENKTFEDLTDVIKDNGVVETYFGVLRMDVDGLGEIFIKGIPDKDKSFSAYATLSSHLDWFFSGYLNTIREKYADNVNILYSGGDDVFAVGRWDLLISFAEDIRSEFKAFVGREDISISAGMSITGNKYPIAKAAELAGNAEHFAKIFDSELGNKNAFHFLGTTVSWNTEFAEVKSKKNEFVSLINNYGMSKGILHRIMLFAEIQANNKRNKNKAGFAPDLSYHWNAAYYLKRYMENKDQTVQEFCKTLQIDLLVPRKMELIALAARWAELELKIELLT